MAWLPGFGSAPSSDASKEKAAYEAPDRVKRAKCWDSRDAYFQCLNKNNILDAIREKEAAEKACAKESASFEQNCASSWVSPVPPNLLGTSLMALKAGSACSICRNASCVSFVQKEM